MPNHVQIYQSSKSDGMKCRNVGRNGYVLAATKSIHLATGVLTPQRCVIEHSWRTLPIKNRRRIWTKSTPQFPYMHCQGGQDQKLRIVTIMAKAYSAKPTKFLVLIEQFVTAMTWPWRHSRGVCALYPCWPLCPGLRGGMPWAGDVVDGAMRVAWPSCLA
jgi:hypothetical protein